MKKSVLCKMEIPFKYIDYCMFNGRKIEDNKILKNIFPTDKFCFSVIINYSPSINDIQVTEGKK